MTCRVLGLSRQPYYRWLAEPVTDAEWEQAHLANAIFDAHRDDPEFGYRFLADEVHQAGVDACDRTVWRIGRDNGCWSAFGKPKSRTRGQPGTPAHDDLVRRDFTTKAASAYRSTCTAASSNAASAGRRRSARPPRSGITSGQETTPISTSRSRLTAVRLSGTPSRIGPMG